MHYGILSNTSHIEFDLNYMNAPVTNLLSINLLKGDISLVNHK